VNRVYKINVTSTQTPFTPRQRRRQATLSRILDSAIDLVVDGGFDALSMGRLADQLDYTAGALYRYYPGKDALIAAMTARVIHGFADVLDRVAGLVPEDAHLERVVILPLAWRDLAHAAPQRFGLLSMLLADPRMLVEDDSEAAPAMEAILRALAPVATALDRAGDAGALTLHASPVEHAVATFGAVHGVMQLRKQRVRVPDLFDLDGIVALALRGLLLGWGADPAALDAAFQTITTRGDLVAAAGGMT